MNDMTQLLNKMELEGQASKVKGADDAVHRDQLIAMMM